VPDWIVRDVPRLRGRENFEALKAWATDVRKFCERVELALPEMFAEKCFNETVDKVRHYLRDTFRQSCSSEAECQCATHSLQSGWASRTRQGQGTVADRFWIRAEA